MNYNSKKRVKCVLCEKKTIDEVLNFSSTPLANSYPTTKNIKEKKYKLN